MMATEGEAQVVRVALGFAPVCLFLASLLYLDSYKLVRFRTILQLIAAGGLAAGVSYLINGVIFSSASFTHRALTTFAAPLVEETLKAVPVIFLVWKQRAGFLVDAAIFGFAVGTGFALVENVYYFRAIADSSLALWIVRGFGTAMMHGCSTAIVGMVAKLLSGRSALSRSWFAIPGVFAAYSLHALFNSFLLPPLYSALAVIVVFPPLLVSVFAQSERTLRSWLGSGFDIDSELIQSIQSGEFARTPGGQYLQSLRAHFEGPVLADMLCLLRLQAELALRAKGILMMRENGFAVKRDSEIDEKLQELGYLRRSIGKTGALALAPMVHASAEDVWQLRILESASTKTTW